MTDDEIHQLNREHLAHDYPTDIITFDASSDACIVGDCYIASDHLMSQAKDWGTTPLYELKFVFSISFLATS